MQTNVLNRQIQRVNSYDIEAQRQECPKEAKVCAVFTAIISVASAVAICYGISEFADGVTVHNNTQAVDGLYIIIGGLFGAAVSLISCECLCCC